MNIVWKYLDKRSGTIAALRDYSSMKFIIDHTDEEIKHKYETMESIGSMASDGMPRVHNPQAGEDRLIKGIDEIDVLQERYRQAVEYMEWFMPAWEDLSEDERYVLEAFYDENGSSGALYEVCEKFHVEPTSAYKRKNRAVDHLRVLLFGKN